MSYQGFPQEVYVEPFLGALGPPMLVLDVVALWQQQQHLAM